MDTVTYTFSGHASDEIWEVLEPYRNLPPATTPSQTKLKSCLFHALIHFGSGGPLRYGKTRLQYFKHLEKINKNMLQTYHQPNSLVLKFENQESIHINEMAAGYSSVIPLSRRGVQEYIKGMVDPTTGNKRKISQFQLETPHIEEQFKSERHIYVQAAARLYYIVKVHPGEVTRTGAPLDPEIDICKRLAWHVSEFLPRYCETEGFGNCYFYFEAYNKEFISTITRFLKIRSADVIYRGKSTENYELYGVKLRPNSTLERKLRHYSGQ